ncbi:hypothetical protein HUG10_02985 [Halorarum halophilum]|uniref:Uncharacterized protein n=1 Tax=Halorarum halophilum TaxID=2743090 RepID=A0A7D5L2L2_9EURY|nr:hypothetical protein [Halobaculum halophilum]QLG26563.1 hypothetical protein HUG10_02985 [Halobaculum halophilum]
MRFIRRGLARLVGFLAAVAALPRRAVEGAWDLLTDEAARPGMLYLVALALGFGSFAVYFLRGGGDPTGLELGMQFGSLGVVFYVSLRQAGTAPRRR